MNELKDFFVSSVGAAGALIGLLFVAISVAPQRTFGTNAESEKRAQATGAFIALANVFFVSLAALIPIATAEVVIVASVLAGYRIIRESIALARAYPELRGWRQFGVISLCIYVLELIFALRMLLKTGTALSLVFVVLGLYSYALATSWKLLGARDSSKV